MHAMQIKLLCALFLPLTLSAQLTLRHAEHTGPVGHTGARDAPTAVTLTGLPNIEEPLSLVTDYFIVENSTGQGQPNVPVTVVTGTPVKGSGAHVHEEFAEFGPARTEFPNEVNITFTSSTSGSTDASGKFHFTMKMPSYAGNYPVTALCSSCVNLTADANYHVIHIDIDAHIYLPNFPFTMTAPIATGLNALPGGVMMRSPHNLLEFYMNSNMQIKFNEIVVNFQSYYSKPKMVWVVRATLPDGGTADTLTNLGFWYTLTDWHNTFNQVDVAINFSKTDLKNLQNSVIAVPGCTWGTAYITPGIPIPGVMHITCN